MTEKRRRSQRQTIELEQLKNDPKSLLSWGIDDPTLRKLETYRLYQEGYAVADIAEAFGFSHGYLYEMWHKFKAEGTEALVDKRWGALPRKRTPAAEAAVLRTKALHPERSDGELGQEFGLNRSTVYQLLKEHGLQDLHQVIAGNEAPVAEPEEDEKKKIEIIPCEQALALTLLDGLRQSNYQQALQGLYHAQENAHYTPEQLFLSLVLLSAWGVLRLSHISDQPVEPWGVLLDKPRRPDGDTLDRLLNQIIDGDEVDSDSTVEQRLGQIRPGGIIDLAQQTSFCYWVEAGLTEGDVWYFDDHVTEYTGQAQIGKTKHGTKQISVKSVTRYTLHNGLCSLSEYFPVTVSYAEAMRHLVSKANACLPPESRIGKLAFDRAGWDADLLTWLQETAGIVPITWVKRTNNNVKQLNAVNDDEFVAIDSALAFGKTDRQHIVNVADTTLDFPQLGQQRVVILATNEQKRIAIYTTAPFPGDVPLADEKGMGTVSLIDAMRYKQRIENRFKVEVNEMDSDALPTHKTYSASLTEPYDLDRAQKQLDSAQRRVDKYTVLEQEQQQLYEEKQLDKHQLNLLSQRSQRLRHKANREIETLSHEIAHVAHDQDGQPLLSRPTEVLDVRKLTLLNLFKLHALVALKILARRLGLPEAGPERLRRSFLAFGDRVEFDHDQQIATVYARPFPRGPMQEAYERLCSELHDVPIELMHNGLTYRVRFSW